MAGKLSAEEQVRLGELKGKIIDANGDYFVDADIDELQEYAKLEAKAAGHEQPPEEPEKEVEVKKMDDRLKGYVSPDTIAIGSKTKIPKIVKPWVKKGYVYYGVDTNGDHILWNKDESMFYRLNRDPRFIDALAEKLRVEYLEGLK